ncbi:3-oxo-tetronate kinase [Aureliella helgolandensis]|uniref:3-oxo-tetronate kinase n=1 Tax=Aureliella helgolandensis TaxID=2527968 RepID=A0A518G9L5_9BACT|nr:3-oxo-tetronate kinase [Aureliella helgolandensis]QDV25260.1 hypothetical protein Q31a_35830 [Aureliella helgolandensis]
MLLGCIGDDFTGSSDLANTLAKGGMRTVQYTGIPHAPAAQEVQAGVISLKSRSIAPEQAVTLSLRALDWLRQQGCQQFFFKYCSTFDSTPQGNIGPVADALAAALETDRTIVCPAFPGAGRTVFQGHLFVHDRLLSESGMQNHPLTPMTDPDIRRWMAAQSARPVGHIAAETVFAGAGAIRAALHDAPAGHQVVDALRDEDLVAIGRAARDLPLITGGSGIALGLPENFGCTSGDVPWNGQAGQAVAMSGSCSRATREQVAQHAARHPAREITADAVISGQLALGEVANWLMQQEGVPLLYSSADPDVVRDIQTRLGSQTASAALENFFAETARAVVGMGATRIITAGGETSGAVVERLALSQLAIGPEIDPGVPALRAHPNLVLALKSGNFGAADFFEKAANVLEGKS